MCVWVCVCLCNRSASALNLKSVGFPLKDLNRNDDEEANEEEYLDELYSTNSSKEMNSYRSFLDRFLKPAALQELQKWMNTNPKRAKSFKNVAIYVREFTLPVRPNMVLKYQFALALARYFNAFPCTYILVQKRWSVSPDGGLYVASSLNGPADLLAVLEEAGPLATTAANEARKRDELRPFVRARLGLHSFATHRLVFATESNAANKMRGALEKLAGGADSLRELNLRGQTVVLSHKYAISDDGMLFVPWNFQFEPK